LIKFLTYIDEQGETQEMIVSEDYKLNKQAGDISIEEKWKVFVYEGYKIGSDTYKRMREIPGQGIDRDNKLPYVGVITPVSMIDRIKIYQYMYDCILNKILKLISSDIGKLLFFSKKIAGDKDKSTTEWFQFLMKNKMQVIDTDDDKSANGITQDIVEKDMSLQSEIANYMQIAEFIERKAGETIGLTVQIQSQAAPSDGQQDNNNANILEPFVNLHNKVRQNALESLIDYSRIVYSKYPKQKLSYVLDDMSLSMFSLDVNLLAESDMGIFVSNSNKIFNNMSMVQQLALASAQNKQLTIADGIAILRSESIQEAEEMLRAAETRNKQYQSELEEAQRQHELEIISRNREAKREEIALDLQADLQKIDRKGEWDVKKQAVMSLGFASDADINSNRQPDILEIAEAAIKQQELALKTRKQELSEKKFIEDDKNEKEKLSIEKEKAAVLKKKIITNSV
jgi:hypothetical protein